MKPQDTEVGMICKRMLDQARALQLLCIQPIDIGMRILCIAGTPIDITTIHSPEIGHDIYIVLHDIARNVGIKNPRIED